MEVTCPYCDVDNEIEFEDLPTRACDSEEYKCKSCKNTMEIGWYAEVEVRNVFDIHLPKPPTTTGPDSE